MKSPGSAPVPVAACRGKRPAPSRWCSTRRGTSGLVGGKLGPSPPSSLAGAWRCHHLTVANDDDVTDAEVVGKDDELADPPPTSRAAEASLAVATTAFGLIPVAGPAVAALANYVIGPEIGKRRERWLHELGEVVRELEERMEDFDPRHLEGNEQFVSAASDAAMKTHYEEKLAMLRAAL